MSDGSSLDLLIHIASRNVHVGSWAEARVVVDALARSRRASTLSLITDDGVLVLKGPEREMVDAGSRSILSKIAEGSRNEATGIKEAETTSGTSRSRLLDIVTV
jgi:hypothetical protein